MSVHTSVELDFLEFVAQFVKVNGGTDTEHRLCSHGKYHVGFSRLPLNLFTAYFREGRVGAGPEDVNEHLRIIGVQFISEYVPDDMVIHVVESPVAIQIPIGFVVVAAPVGVPPLCYGATHI